MVWFVDQPVSCIGVLAPQKARTGSDPILLRQDAVSASAARANPHWVNDTKSTRWIFSQCTLRRRCCRFNMWVACYWKTYPGKYFTFDVCTRSENCNRGRKPHFFRDDLIFYSSKLFIWSDLRSI